MGLKYGVRWTEHEKLCLRCMWQLGVPTDKILEALGRYPSKAFKAHVKGYARPRWYVSTLTQRAAKKRGMIMLEETTKAKAARIAKGFSQLELALETGLSPKTVWKVDKGRPVDSQTRHTIARVLGIQPEDIP